MALMLTIERFIRGLGYVAAVLLLLMIGSMIYEVVSRYAFNAPNLWAFDIPWMLGGGCFLLSAGVTLQSEGHVRIDVFYRTASSTYKSIVDIVGCTVFVLPICWIKIVIITASISKVLIQ